MIRSLIAVAVSACFYAGSTGQAQDKQPPKKVPPAALELLKIGPAEFLKKYDKNKDGVLSKDEVPPFLAQAFGQFDKNNDGKLDRKELEQAAQVLRQRFAKGPGGAADAFDFDALDKNADGRLTREELA